MLTVYKYPLEITDEQTVELPAPGKVLCVRLQEGKPHFWAVVDPDQENVTRRVITRGTGHTLTAEDWQCQYIDTFMMAEDKLVFHVFVGTPDAS